MCATTETGQPHRLCQLWGLQQSREGVQFTLRETSTAAPGAAPPQPVYASDRSGSDLAPVAIVAVVAVALLAFGGQLKSLIFGGAGGKKSGRWIRDRSLGGKMIFVPDDDDGAISSPSRSRGAGPRMSALGTVSPTTAPPPPPPLSSVVAAPNGRPEWWKFTPPLPVTATRQLECRKRAKKILRQLEEQKLVSGSDYDTLGLVQLYQTCKVCPLPGQQAAPFVAFSGGLPGVALAQLCQA